MFSFSRKSTLYVNSWLKNKEYLEKKDEEGFWEYILRKSKKPIIFFYVFYTMFSTLWIHVHHVNRINNLLWCLQILSEWTVKILFSVDPFSHNMDF